MHISYCQLDFQKAGNVYTTTNMYLTLQFSIPSMAPILIILLIFAIDKYSLSTSRFTLHPSAPCSLDHRWAPCPLAFLWSSQWSHWQEISRQGQSEVNAFILLSMVRGLHPPTKSHRSWSLLLCSGTVPLLCSGQW